MFKNKEKLQQTPLSGSEKFFKYAAFLFLSFVIYQIYLSEFQGRTPQQETPSKTTPTQEQIDHKVQKAFDKMYQDPEYKKIKDFITHIEKSTDKEKGTSLKTPEGYLLFIPFQMIFKDNSVPDNKILIKSEEVEFYLDYKIIQKILEAPPAEYKKEAQNSDMSKIKSDIENAERNQLMKEISEKRKIR